MLKARLRLVHRHWLEGLIFDELEVSYENRERLESNLRAVGKTLTRYNMPYWTSENYNKESRLTEASIWIKRNDVELLMTNLTHDIRNEIDQIGNSILVEQNRKNNLFNALDLTEVARNAGLHVK